MNHVVGVDSSKIAARPDPGPSLARPLRTCVGCRQKAWKVDLLRIVGEGANVVPDPQSLKPGRGAYLHPRVECLELAVRRRAIPRALRLAGSVDVALVRTALTGPIS